jgi:hypothetical protein
MKQLKIITTKQIMAGLLLPLSGALSSFADTLSVDMDIVAPGIQSIRAASPGDSFTVGLVLTVDALGVSSYGVSALFDNTELSLNGSPAATELLPAGFSFNITPGVASESNSPGEVLTFEAATFGPGPVSTSFVIGTINFTALGLLLDDSVADITPGFSNVGIDGLFDNGSLDKGSATVFAPGFVIPVVPESSHLAMVFSGLLFVSFAGRQWWRSGVRS